MPEAYIVEALRTAGGKARKGSLVGVHPADMGAAVLNALVDRSGVDPAALDDVIVGCVTQSRVAVSPMPRSSKRSEHRRDARESPPLRS